MADMPVRLYRLEVSKGAKLVLSYLWRYAGREPFVWVDRETVACDLGIESDRTLRRHLGELRKAGVIEEDVQVRHGKARPGWWLRDGTGAGKRADVSRDVGGEEGPVAERGPEFENPGELGQVDGEKCDPAAGDEGSEGPAKSGQNWPAADKTDWARTELAADPAKIGRSTSIELPGTKFLSDPPTTPEATSGGGHRNEQGRVRAGFDRLRRWRVHGGDPEGLGPWPAPTTPNGLQLPQLPMGGKLGELLRQDRMPEELHQAVHLVAELIEAGELPASKWRATYVFSGWLEELVVKALELRAKRARAQQRRDEIRQSTDEPNGDGASMDAMIQALGSSSTLRSVADGLQMPRQSPLQVPIPAQNDYIELLDVRSQVQAMAEQLGREPEDILQALGRRSMRELEIGDGRRLTLAFEELRDENRTGLPLPPNSR